MKFSLVKWFSKAGRTKKRNDRPFSREELKKEAEIFARRYGRAIKQLSKE